MEKFKISRDGKRDLAFNGDVICEESDGSHNSTRWTSVSVFRTDKDRFVLKMVHRTQWQGERDTYSATVFDTKEELIAYLEDELPSFASDVSSKLEVVEEI